MQFSTNSRSSGQPKNDAKTLFSHSPSPFHGNFCNCNSIGICTASWFLVQLPLLYTAWSNAYSEIGPEVRCDHSRLLAWKITKRIHSSKPALLNRPIPYCWQQVKSSYKRHWLGVQVSPPGITSVTHLMSASVPQAYRFLTFKQYWQNMLKLLL